MGPIIKKSTNIVDLWQCCICCTRSGVIRSTHFVELYLCLMCQSGLHLVLWPHIGILMRLPAAEPRSIAGLLFPSQYLSGTIWLTKYSMMWDWRGSREGPMPFCWPSCSLLFCPQLFSLSLILLYRLVVWGWGLRTDIMSICLSWPCIANLFNNNHNNSNNPQLLGLLGLGLRGCWKEVYKQPHNSSGYWVWIWGVLKGSQPTNYRPIYITSVLYKVFERLVSVRLGRFVERSGVLPTTQFAYRKGPGTSDALLWASHTLQSALESRQESIGSCRLISVQPLIGTTIWAFSISSALWVLEVLSCLYWHNFHQTDKSTLW